MAERQALTGDSYAIYQEKADAILGEDAATPTSQGGGPPELMEKITRVYTEVYDQPGHLRGDAALGPHR